MAYLYETGIHSAQMSHKQQEMLIVELYSVCADRASDVKLCEEMDPGHHP